MATYGHRHLGFFFRPVVEVDDHGLLFQGHQYGWNAIKRVEVRDSPFDPMYWFFYLTPLATVYLHDGKSIRLNGRALEKRGEKSQVGFFSSKSDAFREVVGTLKAHGATITPNVTAIALQFFKLVAAALLAIFLIFAMLYYLDAGL